MAQVLRLRDVLGSTMFEELDLVINSGGGSIHAAYQIIELLRLHTKRLNACVPFYAKSAATLLCVGSDTIIIDELAQLGPLDTQIYEERKAGKMDKTSFHWGDLTVGILRNGPRKPIRSVVDSELSETRTFTEQLYKEFTRDGRRSLAARLVEGKGNFPWPTSLSTS